MTTPSQQLTISSGVNAPKLNAPKRFLIFMIGFLIGIFFVVEGWMWLLVVPVVGWFSPGLRREFWKVVLIVLMGVLFGAGRFLLAEVVLENDVRWLNGKGEREVVVCVSEEVDVRADRVKYTVSGVRGGGDGVVRAGAGAGAKFEGKVLLNANRYPVYEYGDVLRVYGEFEAPEAIEDFKYDKYLARYGVFSVVNRPVLEKVGEGCGNWFFGGIFKFKGIFEKRVAEIYSEPHGSMVAGLLLGVRRGIPAELTEDFNETGLTHIVAISGYNITLVIIVVFGLFGFLSRRARVVAASVLVVVFVILVGASSAVVRAGIMGVLGLIAVYFGRANQVGMAIMLSAFLMNLWNPYIAVYDVGFQLSFLATLGLVYVSPRLEVAGGVFGRVLSRVPVFFAVRENLIMTLSAQAFALPVILKSFGRFSLICPLANIFVLPFIPVIMIVSFFSVVGSFVWYGLGEGVGFVCYVLLDLVFFLVGGFAELSRAL
jgi:competence protein ComEC